MDIAKIDSKPTKAIEMLPPLPSEPLNQNKSIPLPVAIETVPIALPKFIPLTTPPPPPPPPPLLRDEPKLPETQAPIKKYYGRKRDNQSSSDENSYSGSESNDVARYIQFLSLFFYISLKM